jgi:hypothetical protein
MHIPSEQSTLCISRRYIHQPTRLSEFDCTGHTIALSAMFRPNHQLEHAIESGALIRVNEYEEINPRGGA